MNDNLTVHDGLQVLTFELCGEMFAIEALRVQEVLDRVAETTVPGAPAFVNALINFRGKIIPLADLHVAFDMAPGEITADSRVVVIEFDFGDQTALLGLKADKVHEVTIVEASASEPPPRVGLRWRQDFVSRLVRRDGDVIVVPDLAQIFAARGQSDAVVVPLHSSQH